MKKLTGQTAQFLDLLNEKRNSLGLVEYTADDRLTRYALAHAKNMHKYKFCSHSYYDGENRIWVNIYFGLDYMTGNIAMKGAKQADTALVMWSLSPGHAAWLYSDRKTIIGIGKNADYWSAFIG